MKKEEAFNVIISCAKRYHENLENNNLLFVFGSKQKTEFFETAFLPKHFLHLTGVEVSVNTFLGSVSFYEKCLIGRLSPDDFSLNKNGITKLKLAVLPQLTNIDRVAKMVGDYDSLKTSLYTEKLIGNIAACVGFVRDGEYYVPNTILKEDIRTISQHAQRVLAVYKKPVSQTLYNELCYLAKGIKQSSLIMPQEPRSLISLDENI